MQVNEIWLNWLKCCDEEFDMVQKYFDSNGDGVISFGEFMKAIEGDQGKK